jgi:hypothetical protein
MSIGWLSLASMRGSGGRTRAMFMPGGVGLLGADIDAWDVSAPRGAGAAIVMVVAVSAGLAHSRAKQMDSFAAV